MWDLEEWGSGGGGLLMGFSKDWKGAYIVPKFPEPHQFGNYIQPSRGPRNLGMRLPLPSSVDVTTPSPLPVRPGADPKHEATTQPALGRRGERSHHLSWWEESLKAFHMTGPGFLGSHRLLK